MKEQLDRIEGKLEKLTLAVEHRLTCVETTQLGLKWAVGTLLVAIGTVAMALFF